ncbi:MAG: beta-N-acetylhexosaminidase, partial [Muribaculaceae bacterium]|nr:beta-N-acetylhexosaminidase [Muribaculaceae bacterium]
MRNILKSLLPVACLTALQSACSSDADKELNIIPVPNHISQTHGSFHIDNDTRYSLEIPEEYVESLGRVLGDCPAFRAKRLEPDSGKKVIFREVANLPGIDSPEGYVLNAGSDSIVVLSTAYNGLFYGAQTLVQLAEKGDIPAMTVVDQPRFPYRGFMLDVSRHFRSKEFVKKQIDAMARFKLNRLHLHLTDAAGWRLEIKKYPRLTTLAAWREFPSWKEWWNNGRKYKEEGGEGAYGGYYTQDDIRELVDYAAQRCITIIPEIEMPSHSEEVLAAYPELSCSQQPYKHSDFCVGNEQTFEFLENVLTEVMDLFPSEYIHIGGDEAAKNAWRECRLCQQRMNREGLDNVDELQ